MGFDEVCDLLEEAQRSGDAETLDRAIAGFRDLAAAGPDVRVLFNLGEALRQRFGFTTDVADLTAAIATQRETARAAGPRDPRLPKVLRSLSVMLQDRAERFGGGTAVADLEEAARTAAAAVTASDQQDPGLANRIHALAAAQRLLYQETGDESHLAEALVSARRAAAADPKDGIVASHLGIVLLQTYQRNGDLTVLNEAITKARSAAAAQDDPWHGSMIFNNLSVLLDARHDRLGDSADLDDSVDAAQRAVDLTDGQHLYHGMYQSTLAEILRRRGGPRDLPDAAAAARTAVRVTPPESPRLAPRTALLASILRDEATIVSRSALSSRPDGQVLLVAARCAETPEQAIAHATQALTLITEDDPHRATAHLLLGIWDVANAATHFEAAARQTAAPPRIRCDAAERWARATGDLAAYRLAVELLPLVATPGLGRPDRERHLADRATLAGDAAAAALALDEPAEALRMLEAGRAVLHTQLLDLRSDLTDLRDRDPETAGRLTAAAAALDGQILRS